MYHNKKITVFSHLLVWFVLFSMPYVLSYGQDQEIMRVFAHFWIPLVFYAIVFYLNYILLIDRYLFRKNTIAFVGINIVLISFFLLLREELESTFFQELVRKVPKNSEGSGPPFQMFIYVQMLSYMAPLLFAIAIKTTQRWVKTEAESKEAANFKLKSELQHLHYQLQPHFFFNSLNNIYSLVDISPEQAKSSIHSLSKLMRYMLYETNMEKVTLSKEIDFMKKYIDLMKLRVSDKTSVKYSFPSDNTGIQIAPLLFISLIENAFKHGVSASKESQIDIAMSCDGKTVLFNISNDNFPKKVADKSGSGIGLQNLEKRLALLYPDKYTFTNKVIDNRFFVTLAIETA
ncbi:sensor histidine kinase [Cyclobacterium qasimii]|uniref:Histidine kinase n=2 Tax=Cyclobacterium qasimii TaxID=1350429 RepID=A0A512C796_9BACT|nr:histidine kinase [Cyclobacterium qasimii]EPR65362.1 putative two-component system sensor protein [Cyclobacterium qasimii M12-11B]GEO20083.1 histidine kinase [Cyclobacterium qasimii]